MFRSQSFDHHQGSITVLVQLVLISVHTSSYSGLWLYVVGASVCMVYLSVWYITRHHTERYFIRTFLINKGYTAELYPELSLANTSVATGLHVPFTSGFFVTLRV
jgi:hypothetical protein